MPFVDDVNRLLRDHEGYTGDGQGGVGPLPVGDRSTARRAVWKRDLRDLFITLAQTTGDPSALQAILDDLDDKADLANSGAFFTSRAAMVSAGQSALPGSKALAFHPDGNWLVVRGFGASADDPLFPEPGPRWGVLMRVPSDAITTAMQADLDGKASQTALNDETAARVDGDTASRNRENHSGVQPIGTISGLTGALNGKAPVAVTWDFAGHFTGGNIIASHSGSSIWIGWTGMSIRRSNGLFWSIADRVPALLPLNGVLYVETAGSGNPLPVLQGTANAAFTELVTEGSVVVLLQVGLGRLSGIMAPAVEQVLATRIAASLGVPAVSSAIAQTAAMSESWDTGSTVISIGTSGWYACQPVIRDRVISITNSAATVDLEYLPLGRTVTVNAASGCNVFAGDTSVFVGQPGQRHAQFAADAVFRATRVGATRVMLEPVAGASPTYLASARPAMGRAIVLAGQSQNAIGGTRGLIGGFTDEMMTDGITGQTNLTSNYFIRTAVSGSSATKTATANYWWDDQNDEAGPLLLNAVSAVQAAITAGQPAPAWLIWRQGEGDARSIETGALTGATYKAATQSIWSHFRTLWPNIQVIASPPGASDTPISKRGMAAIRQAYFELTEDLPWAHYGHEMYDVPRNYGNVHPTDAGYYVMGIRDALVMQAIEGTASPNLGPAVISAVRNAAGTITVEIGNAPSDGFPPMVPRDDGPSPYGLSLIIGDPGASDPVPVAYGSCVETGAGAARKLWITLYPTADTTGAYLHTVASQAEHAYRRTYPMRVLQHGNSPGLPLRFQRVQVVDAV